MSLIELARINGLTGKDYDRVRYAYLRIRKTESNRSKAKCDAVWEVKREDMGIAETRLRRVA